jgi:hypothetical protein
MPKWVLAVKALLGGAAVVAFSLVGQAGHSKRFAGLFSAAPSVALCQPGLGLYFLFRVTGLFLLQDRLAPNAR